MKEIFILLIFMAGGFVNLAEAQQQRQYFQIFTDDVIREIKCIEYDNDTTGRILQYRLSEDKTDIYLLNYDGISRIKVSYVTNAGETREISRNKCNIHSLPEL